jgi:SPASM domain peptide maturase of grasp-with-spasm system
VLQYLTSARIGHVIDGLENEEEKGLVTEFIHFMVQHELATFLEDPSMFPALEERWDIPSAIQNAIIDVDKVSHDFDKIFHELDELECQFVQIRSFSNLLALDDVYRVLSAAHHTSIVSVELLLKYDAAVPDDAYKALIENEPILSSLVIHSSPAERTLVVDYGCSEEAKYYIEKKILFVARHINAQIHCGNITVANLNAPGVSNFFETKLFNGCLNRKVSVDASGEIKNCPSMRESYGNVRHASLSQAVNKAGFRDKWAITKDQISICKDCEFRYVCSDCRAYVENPADSYSKPLKCGYDPYTCKWEEWSLNPLRQQVAGYYGMQELVAEENEYYLPGHA